MKILEWPFKSIQNTLALVLQAQDEQQQAKSCNFQSGNDTSGNLVWFQITVGGVAIYLIFYFILFYF